MKKVFQAVFILAVICLTVASLSAQEPKKFLADRHIEMGITCADCHQGIATPTAPAKIDSCLACHGGYEGMAKRTENLEINPHNGHEGPLPCNECHKPHSQSVDHCESCHAFGLVVP